MIQRPKQKFCRQILSRILETQNDIMPGLAGNNHNLRDIYKDGLCAREREKGEACIISDIRMPKLHK